MDTQKRNGERESLGQKADLLSLSNRGTPAPLPRDRLRKVMGVCGCGNWEGGAGTGRGVGLRNREGDRSPIFEGLEYTEIRSAEHIYKHLTHSLIILLF